MISNIRWTDGNMVVLATPYLLAEKAATCNWQTARKVMACIDASYAAFAKFIPKTPDWFESVEFGKRVGSYVHVVETFVKLGSFIGGLEQRFHISKAIVISSEYAAAGLGFMGLMGIIVTVGITAVAVFTLNDAYHTRYANEVADTEHNFAKKGISVSYHKTDKEIVSQGALALSILFDLGTFFCTGSLASGASALANTYSLSKLTIPSWLRYSAKYRIIVNSFANQHLTRCHPWVERFADLLIDAGFALPENREVTKLYLQANQRTFLDRASYASYCYLEEHLPLPRIDAITNALMGHLPEEKREALQFFVTKHLSALEKEPSLLQRFLEEEGIEGSVESRDWTNVNRALGDDWKEFTPEHPKRIHPLMKAAGAEGQNPLAFFAANPENRMLQPVLQHKVCFEPFVDNVIEKLRGIVPESKTEELREAINRNLLAFYNDPRPVLHGFIAQERPIYAALKEALKTAELPVETAERTEENLERALVPHVLETVDAWIEKGIIKKAKRKEIARGMALKFKDAYTQGVSCLPECYCPIDTLEENLIRDVLFAILEKQTWENAITTEAEARLKEQVEENLAKLQGDFVKTVAKLGIALGDDAEKTFYKAALSYTFKTPALISDLEREFSESEILSRVFRLDIDAQPLESPYRPYPQDLEAMIFHYDIPLLFAPSDDNCTACGNEEPGAYFCSRAYTAETKPHSVHTTCLQGAVYSKERAGFMIDDIEIKQHSEIEAGVEKNHVMRYNVEFHPREALSCLSCRSEITYVPKPTHDLLFRPR